MDVVTNNALTSIAVITSLLLAVKAGWDVWAGRRKDNQSLEIARRQAPEVQKQLELGNFKAAMEGVNIAQTIMSSELTRLQVREESLEKESASWERRYNAAEARANAAEARASAAEARASRVEGLMARVESRCGRLEDEVARLRGRKAQS